METNKRATKRYFSKRNNFLTPGFSLEQKTGGLNPNIRAVSLGAKFTDKELDTMSKNHADAIVISDLSEILPYRVCMQNALKTKGYPCPPDIFNLTRGFYENIVKKNVNGKHYQHVEGNPILHKLYVDQNVVAATVGIIPAATSFINAATNNTDPTQDAQIIQDSNDIQAFITAKQNGQSTDNLVASNMSLNPWIIGIVVIAILYFMFK